MPDPTTGEIVTAYITPNKFDFFDEYSVMYLWFGGTVMPVYSSEYEVIIND
jgi:hypothetical protein